LKHWFAVDEREHAVRAVFKRMPVIDRDVRVLADFQRTNAVGNADNLGGIARDGAKRCLLAEAFAHGKPRLNG